MPTSPHASSTTNALASPSSSFLNFDHETTLHTTTPNSPSNSGHQAVTFSTRPLPSDRTPPKRSVKRRPPTPGGHAATQGFRKLSKAPFLPSPPQSVGAAHAMSRSSVIPAASFHRVRVNTNTSPPSSPVSAPHSPHPLPESHEITPKHRRAAPSPLNLSSISNRDRVSPSVRHAEHVREAPVTAATIVDSLAGASSHTPSNPRESGGYQTPPISSPSRYQASSVVVDDEKSVGEEALAPPDEDRDRRSMVTSTVLDSPSTKAIMDRLLSAPDYFELPKDAVSEWADDSSGSLKFARDEDEDDNVDDMVRVHQRVREQRERSKIRKLLGDEVDECAGRFSGPRRVEGFWSDPDCSNDVVARRKGSTRFTSSGSAKGKGRGREEAATDDDGMSGSALDLGYWSSSLPSPGLHRPHQASRNAREERSKTNGSRKAQDGRRMSGQPSRPSQNSSPPVSIDRHRLPSNSQPRVLALESLQPATSIKRSRTISGVMHSPSPTSQDSFLPPPRGSSKYALYFPTGPKSRARSPSPNVSTPSAHSHAATETGEAVEGSTFKAKKRSSGHRLKSSKSSKSLCRHQEPEEPVPSHTPAGVIVEEYKRQILKTQDATVKDKRRLSALQWMIEQTKSVTGHKHSSSSLPESPHSSNQSMSPPFSKQSFNRTRRGPEAPVGTKAKSEDPHSHGRMPSQPMPSPLSTTTNGSSVSLLSPDTRLGRMASSGLGRVGRKLPDEPLSPIVGSASVQPESPAAWSSSSVALPASPRSEGCVSYDTGPYWAAVGGQIGYTDSSSGGRRPSLGKPGGKEKNGFSFNIGRRLSKKRSQKWSKAVEGVVDTGSGNQAGAPRTRPRGRSVVERAKDAGDSDSAISIRRGYSLDKRQTLKHRKSLRLSIDKFADDGPIGTPSASYQGAQAPSVQRSKSSPGHSSPQGSSNNPSKKEHGGGKHFWSFVKRISSNGGLRDKYQKNSAFAVPELPNIQSLDSPDSPDEYGNEFLARLLSGARRPSQDEFSSRTYSTPVTPVKAGFSSGLTQTASSTDHNSYYSHMSGKLQHQGINTRSSTPASSDHASSSRVFHRTHSTRSSVSSFAEIGVPPPLPHPPSAFLSRSFTSRSDGGHYSDGGYRPSMIKTSPSYIASAHPGQSARTPTDEDWMAIDPPFDHPQSLPTPPRRPKPTVSTYVDDDALYKPETFDMSEFDSESPIIPEFSVDNVINTFKPRKRNTDSSIPPSSPPASKTVVSSPVEAFPKLGPVPTFTPILPPPRPARDVRRPPPQQIASATSASPPTDPSPEITASSGKSKKVVDQAGYGTKPPTSAFGPSPSFTKKERSPVESEPPPLPALPVLSDRISQQPESLPGQDYVVYKGISESKGGLNFLSEEEKAQKWNALLEKSEKAGGTLHLTLNQLDSDQLEMDSIVSSEDP